ncbi:MAG TPA: hypothetical protein VJ841_02500 [Candidatus Saccharimonadales bacterium]|nr:hypothetical protein [Candidatus Saccharimonadales bacterium]
MATVDIEGLVVCGTAKEAMGVAVPLDAAVNTEAQRNVYVRLSRKGKLNDSAASSECAHEACSYGLDGENADATAYSPHIAS